MTISQTPPIAGARKPRKTGKSPTQRTLAALREDGYQAGIVEKWVQQIKRRIDLFGIIDIVAVRPGRIVGVQACAGGDHATHRTKVLAEPLLGVWLASGAAFEIHSWAKQGPRGKRKVWVRRVEEITLEDAVRAEVATGEVGE